MQLTPIPFIKFTLWHFYTNTLAQSNKLSWVWRQCLGIDACPCYMFLIYGFIHAFLSLVLTLCSLIPTRMCEPSWKKNSPYFVKFVELFYCYNITILWRQLQWQWHVTSSNTGNEKLYSNISITSCWYYYKKEHTKDDDGGHLTSKINNLTGVDEEKGEDALKDFRTGMSCQIYFQNIENILLWLWLLLLVRLRMVSQLIL